MLEFWNMAFLTMWINQSSNKTGKDSKDQVCYQVYIYSEA